MDSVYTNRIACGIHVLLPYGVVNGDSHFIDIIREYNDVITYSSIMSLLEKGSVFVYIKSTYKELKSDNYDYIHVEDTSRPLPSLTDRETEAINKILSSFCCNPKRLMWINHADIFTF